MRDRGALPHGRAIGGRAEFFLGCADLPIDPPPHWRPDDLARKLDAGAQFVQTQFCMDAQVARRYLERLVAHGITQRAPILIGFGPLYSVHSARWIREHLFGTIIPDTLIERLQARRRRQARGTSHMRRADPRDAGIPGVAGVHLMAPATTRRCPKSSRPTAPSARYPSGAL